MDNIIFERDYKEDKARRDRQNQSAISSRIFDYAVTSGALRTMGDTYSKLPRVINESHKAAYERILNALNRIARIFGGKIKGVVDYQNWEASIYIILPFVEFSSEEELMLLKDIASNTQTVTFTVEPDGNIRMKLLIEYVDVVGNVGNMLEEEIANCPELVAMLEEADKAEKQQLMSNPEIAMIVQLGSASVGVSEEEDLDRVVTFLRNPPEDFLNTLQQWIEEYSD